MHYLPSSLEPQFLTWTQPCARGVGRFSVWNRNFPFSIGLTVAPTPWDWQTREFETASSSAQRAHQHACASATAQCGSGLDGQGWSSLPTLHPPGAEVRGTTEMS